MRLFKTLSLKTTPPLETKTEDSRDVAGEALRKIASGTNVSDVVNGLDKDSSREFLNKLREEIQTIKAINYYTSQLKKCDSQTKSDQQATKEFSEARQTKLRQSKSLQNEAYKGMKDYQKRGHERTVGTLLTEAFSKINNDRVRHVSLKPEGMKDISTTDGRRYGGIYNQVNLNNLNNQANRNPLFLNDDNGIQPEELGVSTRHRHGFNKQKIKNPLFFKDNEGNKAKEDYIKEIKVIKEFLETHQDKFQQGHNSSDEEDVSDVEENFSASYERLFESEVGKKIEKLIQHEMSDLADDKKELEKYFANRNARCIEICNEMLEELKAETQVMAF
jgi:hypothetical protein